MVTLLEINHLTGVSYLKNYFFISDRCTSIGDLPYELVEKILKLVLLSCTYNWPNHVVKVFERLRKVCNFWQLICDAQNIRELLPRIYVPHNEILPKSKFGKYTRVNMQRIIKKAGSFSGLSIALKSILNHHKWNTAWIDLRFIALGWYLIENIWWKIK